MTDVIADPTAPTVPAPPTGAAPTNAPPTTVRRARTQARLMAAAVEVFADRGVIGASVEEICEAAGFTRGAFYSNFPDKAALVLALIEQSTQNQFAAAQQAVDAMIAAGPGRLDSAVGQVLNQLTSSGRPDDAGVLADREVLLYAARDAGLRQPYLEFTARCREQVATLVTDALSHLGLELVVPLPHAVTVLIATHEHERLAATLEQRPTADSALRSLVLAITRPVT